MTVAADLPARHAAVLLQLLRLVPPEETLWAVTGGAGLRLQGVPVQVGDLDLQTDRATAEVFASRLSGHLRTPLHWRVSPRVRSWFAAFEMDGVRVEVMGGLQKRLPDGRWERRVDLAAVRRWVTWRGRSVPVIDLAHEARAYAILGRLEKAALIRHALEARR